MLCQLSYSSKGKLLSQKENFILNKKVYFYMLIRIFGKRVRRF
ncbi:hypothetical protein CpecF_0771 [Chlamydia pecorum DBDeUG]|nr:hypothetical protein CpecF_0771 [Chlamydia pecorum DBDeUG]